MTKRVMLKLSSFDSTKWQLSNYLREGGRKEERDKERGERDIQRQR